MKNKRVLGIDEDREFLSAFQGLFRSRFPECRLDTASEHEEARRLILQHSYDLLLLDTGNFSWKSVVDLATECKTPVLAVVARDTKVETLRYFCTPTVRAFVTKERHEDAISAMEEILLRECTPWWKRKLMDLAGRRGTSSAGNIVRFNTLYASDRDIYRLIKARLYTAS